jgi:hypothetical protein
MGREVADERKRVVQAVRDAGHGKARAELRSLFAAELNRRDMPSDPIWIERMLDELEWSPGERARQTAHRLLLVGGSLGHIAQSRGVPEAPEWMQPPEQASYHVRGSHREKTSVEAACKCSTGKGHPSAAAVPARIESTGARGAVTPISGVRLS